MLDEVQKGRLKPIYKKNIVWSVCLLHTNELSLNDLIRNLDSPIFSNNAFTGGREKLLPLVTYNRDQQQF